MEPIPDGKSTPEIERKPQSHLINILRRTRPHHPNFSLFLGAGASVTSGVKPVTKIVEEWRAQYFEMYGAGREAGEFWKSRDWYDGPQEYSVLFEQLYDQPTQRREFIETCVCDARPSWGYIYLVNLIKNNVFNTVFTTNFDDLLNEACYTFSSSVRPIVCAHDSSIRSVRLTAKRPKIIKLHGDFLFDNIKNTTTELQTLETNMREKFRQYATEFGLIVIGYSGNDQSVMDALDKLIAKDGCFPHGIYWCVRKGSGLSARVQKLATHPSFKLIEITGFDEFFADLQEALGLPLQPEMSDPYGALATRLNRLIEDAKIPATPNAHSVIARDIKVIGEKIEAMSREPGEINIDPNKETAINLRIGKVTLKAPVPYEFLSQVERREGRYERAQDFMMRAIAAAPSAKLFVTAFEIAAEAKREDFAAILVDKLQALPQLLYPQPAASFDMAIRLINGKYYDLARRVLDIGYEAHLRLGSDQNYREGYYLLNILQIKAHQGRDLEFAEVEQLRELVNKGSLAEQMAAKILLRDYEGAETLLRVMFDANLIGPSDFTTWSIFRLLEPHLKDVSFLSPSKAHTSQIANNKFVKSLPYLPKGGADAHVDSILSFEPGSDGSD